VAMTSLDLLTKPDLVKQAKDYFATVQQKNQKYVAGISASDMPQIQLNKETMERFRPEQRKFYYDESKHETYLDQLGIKFPMITNPN
jgi:aminobenzoyl-glutamate utilization protein B